MKATPWMGLSLLCVLLGACDSGGGNSAALQSVDDVTQGSGPALSLATTAGVSTGKSATEAIVVAVATKAIAANESGINQATEDDPDGGKQMCVSGALDVGFGPLNVAATGSGSASFSGEAHLRRSGDTGTQQVATDGTFTGFSVAVSSIFGTVQVSGAQSFSGDLTISQGMNAACAAVSGGSTSGASFATTMTEHWTAAFSLAGAAGAAMTIDANRTTTSSVTNGNLKNQIEYSGTAQIKSGSVTMNCTLANFSTSSSAITATCQ